MFVCDKINKLHFGNGIANNNNNDMNDRYCQDDVCIVYVFFQTGKNINLTYGTIITKKKNENKKPNLYTSHTHTQQ